MKALCTTYKGMEAVCLKELQSLTSVTSAEIIDGMVFFGIESLHDLAKIVYKAQSITNAFLVIGSGTITELGRPALSKLCAETIHKSVLPWLQNAETFSTIAVKEGYDAYTSVELAQVLSNVIKNIATKQGLRLNATYKNPDVAFSLIINKTRFFVGVDFAGIDLSKRSYKIFPNKKSLKGPIAFALLSFVNYVTDDYLLLPYVGDGVIGIEAAVQSTGFPLRYYDKQKLLFTKYPFFTESELFEKWDTSTVGKKPQIKALDNFMGNVIAAKKNAKIAGVSKDVTFTRITMDWIDLKIKEKEVGKIVCVLPQPSKRVAEKKIQRLYKEFFYQAEYVLQDDGVILVVALSDLAKTLMLANSELYKLKTIDEREVWQGQQRLIVLQFKKL